MNLNDFSKWLQYNKEWKIEGGLNTFRTRCIYLTHAKMYSYVHYVQYILDTSKIS